MTVNAPFAKMNGLGNKILVVDMRGRGDKVTPDAAVALAADPETAFDQIMAVYDPKAEGTDAWIDILNCDGSFALSDGLTTAFETLSGLSGMRRRIPGSIVQTLVMSVIAERITLHVCGKNRDLSSCSPMTQKCC